MRQPSTSQMIDLRESDKSRRLAITEFNNCFIIRSRSLFFHESPLEEKRPAFLRKSDHKKEKSVNSFTHGQNIICSQTLSQTQLDDIAHEETIICKQLFAG